MKLLAHIIVTIWYLQMVASIASSHGWPASPWWILVPFGLMLIWGRLVTLIVALGMAFMIWFLTVVGDGTTKGTQFPSDPTTIRTSQ